MERPHLKPIEWSEPNKQPNRKTLTKTVFFRLPAGMYLVSNCHHSPTVPLFAEQVAPASRRGAQWKRIVAARVNGRLFHLFTTADGHSKMVKRAVGARDTGIDIKPDNLN